MTALDDIRDSIVTRMECLRGQIAMAEAELEAHDRAVAAMPVPNGSASARAPRRDIAALVREALTDEPQTVAQIAEKTGCFPSRVLPALKRLGADARVDASQRWSRP
jgi:hypothetical protein